MLSKYEQEDDYKAGFSTSRNSHQRSSGGRYSNNRQRTTGNRPGFSSGGMSGSGVGSNSGSGSFPSSNSNFDIDSSSWRRSMGFLCSFMGR